MLNIIFEDQNYLVINKPSKQHTAIGKNSGTLAEEIINKYPQIKDIGGINNAGMISRLDFQTSGIILAVKNPTLITKINPKKTYFAYVDGLLDKTIESSLFLGQSSRNSKKVRVFEKEPKSLYRALPTYTKIIPIKNLDNQTLIKAEIEKGMRHQIRAHCGFYGHPLTGDSLYGSIIEKDFILHSEIIEFICPITKKKVFFKSGLFN